MNDVQRVVVDVVLFGGVAIELLAVLGVCVMRDVYDRLHYVSLVGFGAVLVAIAIVAREGFSLIGDKALLVAAILLVLSPVLVHTTARSFRTREHGDWRPNGPVEAAEIPEQAT